MLVLTRKINESIVITEDNSDILAKIVVTNIDKNQVKIGIGASVGCKVWRKELYEKMLREENKKEDLRQ